MPYKDCKIYYDGSNYIAIPSENFSRGKPSQSLKKQTHKAEFESAYAQSKSLPKKERNDYLKEQLKDCFSSETETQAFIDEQTKRKRTNAIKRRVTLMRKVNLQQEWNYFVTFTYDSNKLDENTFKKKLMNTLKHMVSRKQWKYIGVWERSPEKQRLHFHGIFYIPGNGMMGTLEQVTDYDTKTGKKKTYLQSKYFKDKFGRNEFSKIIPEMYGSAIRYITKYLSKQGVRPYYSKGLYRFIESDIDGNDVICRMDGTYERDIRLIVAKDFRVWDEGVLIGEASPETMAKAPKVP